MDKVLNNKQRIRFGRHQSHRTTQDVTFYFSIVIIIDFQLVAIVRYTQSLQIRPNHHYQFCFSLHVRLDSNRLLLERTISIWILCVSTHNTMQYRKSCMPFQVSTNVGGYISALGWDVSNLGIVILPGCDRTQQANKLFRKVNNIYFFLF